MRPLLHAVGALVVVCGALPQAASQWPAYLPPNAPRIPNGQPNLEAPAPRTADGKPDLSGVWQNYRADGGKTRSVNEQFLDDRPASLIPQFRDIGAGIEGGLPYQPWAAELRKSRMATNSKDNPDAHCLPLGLTQLHMHIDPRKIIQTPHLIVIMYEANYGLRQIFLDGRPMPSSDPQPWWYGYSVGKWEGDVLVVETRHIRDGGWLDINGSPLTDQGTITERFRRLDYGHLGVEITVDDPKAYTKPWTVKITQRLLVDSELIEFICNENERDAQRLK